MAIINVYFRVTDIFPTSSSGDGFDSGIWGPCRFSLVELGGLAAFGTSLQCIICHFAWQADKHFRKVKLGKDRLFIFWMARAESGTTQNVKIDFDLTVGLIAAVRPQAVIQVSGHLSSGIDNSADTANYQCDN